MSKKVFLVIAVFAVILFALSKLINTSVSKLYFPITNNSKPAPTPFLFQELTIPYLRSREYKSSLGTLTKLSENSVFTSYLTNYDSDGLKINALLTVPVKDKPEGGFPAIVFVHGYIPPTLYKTTQKYEAYIDYLAKNGFVVLKIDLRGNGDSEGIPGGAYYSGDYVIDTINAYSALQNSDFVNPKKVGLWGHSMAGNVTFRAYVAKKDIPALVIWAGAGYTYTDLITYRIMDQSYRPPTQNTEVQNRRKLLNDTYGSFSPDSIFWKQVPATNYLDGVDGSIQVHHAKDDNVVSIEYSRNLMKILDATQIPHELFEYPSGGHNITDSSFSQAMQRTVKFYKEKFNK